MFNPTSVGERARLILQVVSRVEDNGNCDKRRIASELADELITVHLRHENICDD